MPSKLDWKLVLLYTLLVLQVLVVMVYVTSTPHVSELNAPADLHYTVSFVGNEVNQDRSSGREEKRRKQQQQLRTVGADTTLRETKTFRFFEAYNETLCWRAGVDERRMRRELLESGPTERCTCLPGWHGTDCGQPEVVWRALMASKSVVRLQRRKLARRLILAFCLHDYSSAIAEVIVEELYSVVDLFVICDFSNSEDNFRHKLAKGLLAQHQDKILYVAAADWRGQSARGIAENVWHHTSQSVRNLRDDDLYVRSSAEEILSARALMFLKTYDGWPQPIGFRLRWSVFGFFWQHPSRTRVALGASSLGPLRDAFHFRTALPGEPPGAEEPAPEQPGVRDALGLLIGDLNHYGGWYCQFCEGPAHIVTALRANNSSTGVSEQQQEHGQPVDVPFVEELIGAGTWFDERTSLLRTYRSRDAYYAPEAVLNNSWKYDWLLENFYAKLDYY